MQALIKIERAKKGEHDSPAQTELGGECMAGHPRAAEHAAVDRIGNHGKLVAGNTPSDRILTEPLTDRRNGIGGGVRGSRQISSPRNAACSLPGSHGLALRPPRAR